MPTDVNSAVLPSLIAFKGDFGIFNGGFITVTKTKIFSSVGDGDNGGGGRVSGEGLKR